MARYRVCPICAQRSLKVDIQTDKKRTVWLCRNCGHLEIYNWKEPQN